VASYNVSVIAKYFLFLHFLEFFTLFFWFSFLALLVSMVMPLQSSLLVPKPTAVQVIRTFAIDFQQEQDWVLKLLLKTV